MMSLPLTAGLVFFDEILHLINAVSEFLALEVRILSNEPGLGHCRLPSELVDLKYELKVLPSLLPPPERFSH